MSRVGKAARALPLSEIFTRDRGYWAKGPDGSLIDYSKEILEVYDQLSWTEEV